MPLPQIIVKIHDAIPIALDQGGVLSLDGLAALAGSIGWNPFVEAIRAWLPNLALSRAFDSIGPAELADLVATAEALDPDYSPPIFENYLRIICPGNYDTAQLVLLLNQWSMVVEIAYDCPLFEDAQVVGTSNPLFSQQDHLKAAPAGINAPAAWQAGADGSNVRVVDIEHAWLLGHEDLPAGLTISAGINRATEQGHGTAIVGIIAAVDNGLGVVGISPNVAMTLLSIEDRNPALTDTNEVVESRILDAILLTDPGDIILLELQGGGRPIELFEHVWHSVRLATASRRIVVEAAGNGNANLAASPDNRGHFILDPSSPEFRDSKAIMVAACQASANHPRSTFSCHGDRIDCHAFGERVRTTGSRTDPVPINGYFDMTGTSSAAAIVAGVCALCQHLMGILVSPGSRFTTEQMRSALRDPQNGTPSVDSALIKSMPDLAKILANEFI